MEILFTITYLAIIGCGILCIIFGSSKKSFLLISLGINIAVPIAYFIGMMATDAPTSTSVDFLKGFLFIQGIPIILFIISSLLLLLFSSKNQSGKKGGCYFEEKHCVHFHSVFKLFVSCM